MNLHRIRAAIIGIGSVVALAIVFFFLLQGRLYTALVLPIARDFAVLRFYASRVSQSAVWLAVVATLILILYSFYRRTARAIMPRRLHAEPASPRRRPTNPLRQLAAAVRHARHSPVYRHTVIHELIELTVRIIARRDRISLVEARRRFKAGTWCDNSEVRDFLAYERFMSEGQFDPDFERKLNEAIDYLERLEQRG